MGVRACAQDLSVFSIGAFAAEPIRVEVVQPVAQGSYSVGVGSRLRLTVPGETETQDGEFLGRLVQPDGTLNSYIVYEAKDQSKGHPNDQTIEYIPAASVSIEGGDAGFQDLLKLYDQEGETCAAYAVDDFLQQLHLTGFAGNGQLAQTLSTEQGRTQLLVDAVSQYYLEPNHRSSSLGILNGFGKRFGFKCKKNTFSDIDAIRAFLSSQMAKDSPVVVTFDVGPDMFDAPYTLIDTDHPDQPLDNRLWLPRERGKRDSGGHAVVAAASFEVDGKLRLVMLDSDWDAPRVWDFETVFNSKTALDEVEFDSCSGD